MPENKKVVIKVDVHDSDDRRKVLKAVSGLSGIESVSMDMKEQKLTIIGDVDPVDVVGKLKKWCPNILTVGPAKEEKKPEKKPEAEKKPETEEEKKKRLKDEEEAIKKWVEAYRYHYPYMTQRYCVHSVEDDPTGCVIC
ncbi:hypothetical protein QVD17_39911 [Tagetes erecta]|uniref:HMA domain-containing protein n=1 Tax=Tagetes erecta TaxID=13708 RepID=A0AAD8JPG3_TARER|nr:hypothetical protein QVD17_39911 [Tagetes erecta]